MRPNTLLSKNSQERIGHQSIILDQARLNIEVRTRTSRLPWRGQFSPELIEYLINTMCNQSKVFLDPFCGSGTVLYEVNEKARKTYGCEINPAAWHLASLASFSLLTGEEKDYIIAYIKNLMSIISYQKSHHFRSDALNTSLLETVNCNETHPFLRKVLAACILLGMGNSNEFTQVSVAKALLTVLTLLNELRSCNGEAWCFLEDARGTKLPDMSVDAVITSPPYVNVFNYHQNYRPAVELLGWKPLEAALSEIGANRKHRQNRFLTVVQYSIDMAKCLDEMARIMKDGSPLILILGRTSNVLGASFENSRIIKNILFSSDNFFVAHTQERGFISRFGERIYEDIIIAYRQKNGTTNISDARKIGIQALSRASLNVPEKNRKFLQEAIEKANSVLPSPMLNIKIPPAFTTIQEGSF